MSLIELVVDAILESSEEELREAWGNEEFERLAREGQRAVSAAFASIKVINEGNIAEKGEARSCLGEDPAR